jgi:hypothetical protein
MEIAGSSPGAKGVSVPARAAYPDNPCRFLPFRNMSAIFAAAFELFSIGAVPSIADLRTCLAGQNRQMRGRAQFVAGQIA